MLLLAMTMGYSNLKACHEGDFGALNKGHYKWGKNVGIFNDRELIFLIYMLLSFDPYLWRTYNLNCSTKDEFVGP